MRSPSTRFFGVPLVIIALTLLVSACGKETDNPVVLPVNTKVTITD